MLNPVEIFIAFRHLKSKNRSRFISLISLISLFGIGLSVAVLIVVLSVMNGFEYEVRERILSVISHGSISGMDGRLDNWQELNEIAVAQTGVKATSPYVQAQGMLVGSDGVAGVELRGILPQQEKTTSGLNSLMIEGGLNELAPKEYRIIIGRDLALRLGAQVGDNVIMLTSKANITPAGLMPRMRRFQVVGIFYAGMYEFDRSLAYIHLDDAARLMRFENAVSGINVSVLDPLIANNIVRSAAQSLGGGVYITDWTQQYANFFRSIEMTRNIIFIILLMVVAVAAFNIVSTLIMIVRDKASEIAILRTMGASRISILMIFVGQGMLIGLIGTFIGMLIGLLIALNLSPLVGFLESILNTSFVSPDIYFINQLPSQVLSSDVIKICSLALLLATFATIYPALRAALTNPAEALRHE
ncbi:MAG: lipoprotein-releasing ABC transporter permease subunit [Pseudomonadota bacterium]|nr:lipoprotein-releasing ABC transporter permease subunit [Pseudomonadota bacterium]